MKFQELQHDEAILRELGHRLAQLRIELDLTQAKLAGKAGVGKRTLERLEAGESTQTRTLCRLLRELDLLEKLDLLLPEPKVRPSQAVKQAELLPKRATGRKSNAGKTNPWTWGDEQ
jgi:transcriptional regulator with XRE-family HTH domain